MKTSSVALISATQKDEASFWGKTPLGQSLRRIDDDRIRPIIFFDNSTGLPVIYNRAIKNITDTDIMIFIHDDVWIDDHFIVDHTSAGLETFDIIGVAGNRRRTPFQPSWAFIFDATTNSLRWDERQHLSGAIAHGEGPFGRLSRYGPTGLECELLDGVLLAVKQTTILKTGLRFDPRFSFHFYDLDFCRSARTLSLPVGTWPISITHQSTGSFGSDSWKQNWNAYLEKWGE